MKEGKAIADLRFEIGRLIIWTLRQMLIADLLMADLLMADFGG
ncbi:MAG: hypothetical protein ACTHLE_02335 [Agriterribacter sp.]